MSIVVAARFNGPPDSGNGGYVCGLLAGTLPGSGRASAVSVTLRQPPPLETPLSVLADGDGTTRLVLGTTVVAEAADGPLPVDPVPPVSVDEARRCEAGYPGLSSHPFPTCFVCGPARAPGDGLRLSPGRPGPGRTACTWTPDASLADPDQPDRAAAVFVWAALDCPGGWTSDLEGRPLVLGRMTAQVRDTPSLGETCVVAGALLGGEGRKVWTSTTAFGADGRELGRAHATWISIS